MYGLVGRPYNRLNGPWGLDMVAVAKLSRNVVLEARLLTDRLRAAMVTAAVKRVRLSVARSMILDTMSEGGGDVSLSRSLRRSRTDPELREEVTRTGQPIV